jgi:tetratricopeptide (TPR) repeat protein
MTVPLPITLRRSRSPITLKLLRSIRKTTKPTTLVVTPTAISTTTTVPSPITPKRFEIDPRYAGAYHQRGLMYGNKNDYDRAIADHTKAIEILPLYADLYYDRGIAYFNKGDHDRAIADYRRTLANDPNHRSASAELERLGASK